MIKTFILYYLNIKSTHGYEIQKYIQVNQMDNWTKIQSGSIYYALSKLEKEKSIELFKEESIGAKVRKIYKITEQGKQELKKSMKEELNKEIYNIGSDKFIIYPILNGLEKEVLVEEIKKHIKSLYSKKDYVGKWRKIKINVHSLKVEAICFEMMLSSIMYQISWHEALLEEIDSCIMVSKQLSDLIRQVDFSTVEDIDETILSNTKASVDKLREEILANPEAAAQKLEELIKMLNK